MVLCYFSIRTVLTVWYFFVFHGCWNCPDCVVFCCFLLDFGTGLTVCYYVIFLLDFATVLTVWYFVVFHGCWNWPDSVVFFVFLLDFGTVLTGILLFFMDIGTVLTVRYFIIFLLELS